VASEAPEAGHGLARREASPALLAAVLGLGALLLLAAIVLYSRTDRTVSAAAGPLSTADAQLGQRHTLYPPDDRWASYLADEQSCPGGERTDIPLAAQAAAMVCLIDYARTRRGLTALSPTTVLDHAALAKAARIVGCRQFADRACGIDPASEARAGGYHDAFGENLYLASGRSGAPRAALDGWLNTAGYRENLFRAEWRSEGIAVETVPEFGAYRDATLWVHELGTG
jgi:uncharacterized protein YkwD